MMIFAKRSAFTLFDLGSLVGFFGGAFCKSHKSLEKLSDKPSCLMLFYQLYSYFQLSFIGLFFAYVPLSYFWKWLLLTLNLYERPHNWIRCKSNSNFGRLLFDFRIAQKDGKTAPNLLFLLIEREEKKSATTKRDWQFLQSVERLTVSCQQRWNFC